MGKGKFGQVRAAIHKKTGERVAVKIVKKANTKPGDIELVKREIEILKLCQHPNLIRLLDVFENNEYIYLVMELLKGGDLFAYLEKRSFHLTEPRACHLIHSVAAAIFYLHRYGIMHRDLKLDNLLMTDDSDEADVKIVDFGLSKLVGPTETCSEPFGTLGYVAPEVLQRFPYNKSIDIWSLGIISYILLSGLSPFEDENEKEIMRYIPIQYIIL